MRNQIRREIHCFIAHTTWRGLKRRLLWDHQCPLGNPVLRERYMYPVGLINTDERGIKKGILLTNIRVFFLLKLVLVKSTIPNAKKLWNFSQFWCRKFQIQPPETLYLRYRWTSISRTCWDWINTSRYPWVREIEVWNRDTNIVL